MIVSPDVIFDEKEVIESDIGHANDTGAEADDNADGVSANSENTNERVAPEEREDSHGEEESPTDVSSTEEVPKDSNASPVPRRSHRVRTLPGERRKATVLASDTPENALNFNAATKGC